MAINAHRAFYREGADDTYLSALNIDEEDRLALRAVRDEIRETLRQGFRDWEDYLGGQEMFEHAALAKVEFAAAPPPLRPKFKMQGSWSYDTLNRTTHEPPQEIDLDDGVFLPVSFLSQNGEAHPAVISGAYFAAVEAMLAPICEKRGWTLSDPKPSCVRVEVRDGAHVDLALYAIPDDDFAVLIEKAEASVAFAGALDEQIAFTRDVYPRLPSDHIMLAHRDEGWKPSDPRKLEEWFKAAIALHGYQLRRVCRYLKAWRDHHWGVCRLSSITLMACTVAAFDQLGSTIDQTRDDKALLMAAEQLAMRLNHRVYNPVVAGQFLDDGWSTEMRREFITEAQELAAGLRVVLNGTRAADASAKLCELFGDYLPDDADLLVVESAPSILTTGMLGDFEKSEEAQRSVRLGGDSRVG
ncbi:CBASS cGAMP synthase [Sphingomonas sp. PAMC 26605]|uniref:CBASS cGAMP synthase n=1 Tax=Sphingomonas sp. PAMC 26605 TaxID=1112214 RepID=UPI00031648CB|nr:hypothetical protein [Sphingomonas sp. PAMC 26605]